MRNIEHIWNILTFTSPWYTISVVMKYECKNSHTCRYAAFCSRSAKKKALLRAVTEYPQKTALNTLQPTANTSKYSLPTAITRQNRRFCSICLRKMARNVCSRVSRQSIWWYIAPLLGSFQPQRLTYSRSKAISYPIGNCDALFFFEENIIISYPIGNWDFKNDAFINVCSSIPYPIGNWYSLKTRGKTVSKWRIGHPL